MLYRQALLSSRCLACLQLDCLWLSVVPQGCFTQAVIKHILCCHPICFLSATVGRIMAFAQDGQRILGSHLEEQASADGVTHAHVGKHWQVIPVSGSPMDEALSLSVCWVICLLEYHMSYLVCATWASLTQLVAACFLPGFTSAASVLWLFPSQDIRHSIILDLDVGTWRHLLWCSAGMLSDQLSKSL